MGPSHASSTPGLEKCFQALMEGVKHTGPAMQRTFLLTALFSSALLAGAVAAEQVDVTSRGQSGSVIAQPVGGSAHARVEAEQAMDAAVAAALIGAISQQFGERRIDVKLQRLDSEAVNLIDSRLTGVGELRLGTDSDWIPMQFAALYDSVGEVVTQPRLTIGRDDQPGQTLQADSDLAKSLRDEVSRRLNGEFEQQKVSLSLDGVNLQPLDARYSRLQARGLAGFGSEGTAQAAIQAVYDTQAGSWVQVDYELGAGSASLGELHSDATETMETASVVSM